MKPVKFMLAMLFMALATLTTYAKGGTKTIYVSDQKVSCAGSFECMQVKYKAKGKWEVFNDSIAGFDYHEGYAYKIKVAVTEPKNTVAGKLNDSYKLVTVISKKKTSYNPAVKIANKMWWLVSMYDNKREVFFVKKNGGYLKFDIQGGKFSGRGICNSFTGTVKADADGINMSNVMGTKVMCSGVQVERILYDFLAKTTKYILNGDTLILQQPDGMNITCKLALD